jgi:hypothetical protein
MIFKRNNTQFWFSIQHNVEYHQICLLIEPLIHFKSYNNSPFPSVCNTQFRSVVSSPQHPKVCTPLQPPSPTAANFATPEPVTRSRPPSSPRQNQSRGQVHMPRHRIHAKLMPMRGLTIGNAGVGEGGHEVARKEMPLHQLLRGR